MMSFALPRLRVFDDLPRDVRLAMRLLVKDRWFTAAAIFALSLGIAANTTVYTVVNTMMLRGLPVAHPDRFVAFLDSLRPPALKYPTAAQRMAFFERLLDRVGGTPAVQSASITNAWPFGYTPQWRAAIDEGSPTDEHVAFTASYVTAGPRYFETLGVTVVRGRDFDELDGSPGHDAAIVNQLLAASWFGGADPIGRRIAFSIPGRARRRRTSRRSSGFRRQSARPYSRISAR